MRRLKQLPAHLFTLCLASAVVTGPAAPAAVMDGRSFDLVVVQATPGGIAMAVHAAREGLGVWDTLHESRRAPVCDEVRQAIFNHYRKTCGENSPNIALARLDADVLARAVFAAERTDRDATEAEFAALLPQTANTASVKSKAVITRQEAVRLMWELVPKP